MNTSEKLSLLRKKMLDHGLDGVLVPRSDEHLGENVPACAERLAWLTGFTGSAGTAIVLTERASVFSDGRYVLQLAQQTDGASWERLHSGETPPPEWVHARAAEAGRTLRIGYDPRVVAQGEVDRFSSPTIDMVALDENPIDRIWHDRPLPPTEPVRPHRETLSGRSSGEKRAELASVLRDENVQAALLTDPASIAWLLNIRGGDLATVPVALGFAILHADERVDLFIDPGKLDAHARAWLGNAVSIAPLAGLEKALADLGGKRVRVDPQGSPAWFGQRLREAGADIVAAADPCAEPKARKNATERDGMRSAHRRDGIAVCRFLCWVESAAGRQTEMSAVAALRAFRSADPSFLGDSFDAISGAGEHGAVIHYRATPETDRHIGERELFLIDSGGQYDNGTTDVTRTVWTGGGEVPAAWKDQFTRVLKGMIAICTASFPDGVTGHRLDALARDALWRAGLDYDHGTGHGVGSVLAVHEGPANISAVHRPVPIAEGMVLSDEPGYYEPGSHGIRIENLLLVVRAEFANAKRPFLAFETLTLAPIDRRCIEKSLLDDEELRWLDDYHARVLREIGPGLESGERDRLAAMCEPIMPRASALA